MNGLDGFKDPTSDSRNTFARLLGNYWCPSRMHSLQMPVSPLIRKAVCGRSKEDRNCGKSPCSTICVANMDVSVLLVRWGVKKVSVSPKSDRLTTFFKIPVRHLPLQMRRRRQVRGVGVGDPPGHRTRRQRGRRGRSCLRLP